MSTLAIPSDAAPPLTLAAVLHGLGDLPPHRVRARPAPGDATTADLLKPENRLCELVDGTLVEKAVGLRESILARFLAELFGPHVRKHNLGILSGADGPYELTSGLVRLPDLAFASWDRLPNRRVPDVPVTNIVPDLVVEVLSASNSAVEMERKRGEYFQAGVVEVWEIQPRTRSVRVYSAVNVSVTHDATATLSTPLLPGFTLSLAQLFAELDRHG